MNNKFKKYTGMKFLAFCGFPLILHIFSGINCLFDKNHYMIFEYTTALITIPYIFITLFISALWILIEIVRNKDTSNNNQKDLLSDILFSIGLTIYLLNALYVIALIIFSFE